MEAKSREELALEKAVFGDTEGFENALFNLNNEALESDEEAVSDEAASDDDDLFYVDKGSDASGASGVSDASEDSEMSDDDSYTAVWNDSDDDNATIDLLNSSQRLRKLRKTQQETKITGRDYEARLRAHFEKLYPKPQWTQTRPQAVHGSSEFESDDDAMSDEDEVLRANPLADVLNRSTNYLTTSKLKMIPTSDIDIQRLADVTKQRPSQAVVQTIQFHPFQPLVLTGGYDRTLRIYHIDGKTNPVATSLYIENCPFQTALFHPDGKRVIAAGRRRYLFFWDLETGSVEKVSRLYGQEHTQQSFEKFVLSPCGKYIALLGSNGWMNLLSASTGQWLSGAKIEGHLVDVAWTEPETMTLVNSQGDVYIWDVESREVQSRWRDPSLVNVTKVAQSQAYIALGMENGIVAVYSRRNPILGMRLSDAEPETRQANAVVENLVTRISSMEFNPDGQLLVVASRLKRDALRIVHVPSFTVYKNWPTSSTPLGHVSCVAWSPQNRMLAAGNEGGYARLWALNHYA